MRKLDVRLFALELSSLIQSAEFHADGLTFKPDIPCIVDALNRFYNTGRLEFDRRLFQPEEPEDA